MKFVASMSPNWNISLFHYRNNGSDYGRIVVGMQVPLRRWPNGKVLSIISVIAIGMKAKTQPISYF